jgi:hypothetical protein
MKRLAGMLAVALATAAQSQTPTSDQMPTPAATEATSLAPIAAPNTDAAPAPEAAARELIAPQARIAPTADTARANVAHGDVARADASHADVDRANSARADGTQANAAQANAAQDNAAQDNAAQDNAAQDNAAQDNAAQANPGLVNAEQTDVAQAVAYLKSAAADFTNCRRASACKVYFDTFGVAIPFADGSIVPFSHVQRLSATSRECVKKAKALEEEGNRSLAVQWAMAARIENRAVRDWLGSHPDAVLVALRQVTVL